MKFGFEAVYSMNLLQNTQGTIITPLFYIIGANHDKKKSVYSGEVYIKSNSDIFTVLIYLKDG